MGKTYAIRPDLRRIAWLPLALFAFLATWALFDMRAGATPSMRLVLTSLSALFGLTSAAMLLYFRRNTVRLMDDKVILTSWNRSAVELPLTQVRRIERTRFLGSTVYVLHYGTDGKYVISANFVDWQELGEALVAATGGAPLEPRQARPLRVKRDEDVPVA